MTIKCETMAETASTQQARESHQASVVDDSSAKTIEFLRARLLAERAASKAARQQAQEIAEKVKDLNVRLEMEIKSRKEAESAMGKVFILLKAKGLAVDALDLTDLEDQLGKGVSSLDDIKEMNKGPQDLSSSITDPSIDKEVLAKPLQNKDESAENGTREPHVCDLENGIDIVSEADQTLGTHCNMQEPSQQNAAAKHNHVHVHPAVTDKPMVYADNMSPTCPPNVKDSHTARPFDGGSSSITLKLKAMLHRMQEEVAALPKEQPLKLQLQSWVDHAAGVLDMEKEPGLKGNLDGICKAGTYQPPLKETEIDNAVALNQIQGISEGVDAKEEMGKTLSVVPKDTVQQKNVTPPLTNYYGPCPSAMYPPTGKDPVLPNKVYHNRRSSCDSSQFLQPSPQMPMHPQMMQYGISQPNIAHASLFANSYTANSPPYYVEAQSPRSSDVVSLGDGPSKVAYRHGQWCKIRPHIERQAIYREDPLNGRNGAWSQAGFGYREDPLNCRSGAWSQAGFGSMDMLSSPYIVDVSSEQDKFLNTRNIQLERAHSYSHRTYKDQVENAAEFNMSRHPKSFPVSDATLSLTDDRNGRLGDILMVLNAARQHVNDEEQSFYAEEQIFGPPTPKVEEARLNRGYQYGDDMQQVPYEHLNHMWQSQARTQTPIIQFPPSPASEHGYSPFERKSRHRRSSSVSANFGTSGWDSYLQPRGEVQLGNGITLYTDW